MNRAFLFAMGLVLVFGTPASALSQSKSPLHSNAHGDFIGGGVEGKVEFVTRRHGGHRGSHFRGHRNGGHRGNHFRSHRHGGHRGSHFRNHRHSRHRYGYNNRGYGYRGGYGFKGGYGGLHFYQFFRPNYRPFGKYYRNHYSGYRHYNGYGYNGHYGYRGRYGGGGLNYGPYLYPEY